MSSKEFCKLSNDFFIHIFFIKYKGHFSKFYIRLFYFFFSFSKKSLKKSTFRMAHKLAIPIYYSFIYIFPSLHTNSKNRKKISEVLTGWVQKKKEKFAVHFIEWASYLGVRIKEYKKKKI
jgi:hypothetical protein